MIIFVGVIVQKPLNLKEMNVLKNIRNFEAQSMNGYIGSLVEWGSVSANLHAPNTPPLSVNAYISTRYTNPAIEKKKAIVGFCAYIPINHIVN